MTLVHQILIALRTLTEEEPQAPRRRRRRPNDGSRNNNRSRQTAAIVLTFRDLFRSGGLNFILDEMDVSSRSRRSSTRNSFAACNNAARCLSVNAFDLRNHKAPVEMSSRSDPQDETTPLLVDHNDTLSSCRELIVSPAPVYPSGLFSSLSFISRKNKKPVNLAVPLSCDNENKTVETLRKVLKWSPKKQNSATFAVPLPKQEEHEALAVVQNAVNIVKEEQEQKKKKKRKFWLKICKI